MIITHELKMDLARRGVAPRIDVVQDDRYSRDLAVSLYCNGRPWTPGEGVFVTVRYAKKDGTSGTYDLLPDGKPAGKIKANVVTVALAPQVCTAAGWVKLAVCFMKDKKQLHTFVIELDVLDNPGLQTTSEDYYRLSNTIPDTGWEPGKFLGTDESGNVVALDAPEVDATLTHAGQAADAKAVGDKLAGVVRSVNGSAPDADGNVVFEDSSAATGLPLPEFARVGQFFQVTEVDASGQVTALQAVDINAEVATRYLYGGVELPPPPAMKANKYYYVYKSKTYEPGSVLHAVSHWLYIFNTPLTAWEDEDGNMRFGIQETGDSLRRSYRPVEWPHAWGVNTGSTTPVDFDPALILWASYDICDADGNVILAASEITPVFSQTEAAPGGQGLKTITVSTVITSQDDTKPNELTAEEAAQFEEARQRGLPIIVSATVDILGGSPVGANGVAVFADYSAVGEGYQFLIAAGMAYVIFTSTEEGKWGAFFAA